MPCFAIFFNSFFSLMLLLRQQLFVESLQNAFWPYIFFDDFLVCDAVGASNTSANKDSFLFIHLDKRSAVAKFILLSLCGDKVLTTKKVTYNAS